MYCELYIIMSCPGKLLALLAHCWGSNSHPDSKVHGTHMGPIWGRQDPGGTQVGPMLAPCYLGTCWFALTKVIKAELWLVFFCWPDYSFGQITEWPWKQDTMMLKWCHYNVNWFVSGYYSVQQQNLLSRWRKIFIQNLVIFNQNGVSCQNGMVLLSNIPWTNGLLGTYIKYRL